MKITHVIARQMSEGEASRLAALLGGLSEHFEVGLIAPESSEVFALLSGTRVKLSPQKSLGESRIMTRDIYKILGVLREDKPHVLHSHSSPAARVAARACGVKYLVSEGRERVGRLYNALVNLTVSPSETEAMELIYEGLLPSRIARLDCGVPELCATRQESLPTVVSKCLTPDEYRLVISALGRVSSREELAAELFVPEEEIAAASRLAALVCPSGCISVRPRAELSSYEPRESSVLVYPVLRDARLPLLPMRYMSAGIPVVASDTAQNREFFSGEAGVLFFVSGDPFSLAGRLSTLFQSRESRERLSSAARAAWERRFSPENMIEGYGSIYRALARVGKIEC